MSKDLDTTISNDYENLKCEHVRMRKEFDKTKQELYEAKNNVNRLESMQYEYQSDIELLQSKIDAKKAILEERSKLEELCASLKLKHHEEMLTLESNLSKCEEEKKQLLHEIEVLKNKNITVSNKHIEKFTDDICNLKEENLNVLNYCEELKAECENLQKHNAMVTEKLSEAQQEIEELKNSLCSKKDELRDANELVEKLNEELMCVKTELEEYKNKPVENSEKGNSLFAEVNDRRVYLQETLNNMKSEFKAMTQERARHLRDIHRLKVENKLFLEKWKADLNEKFSDHDTELKTHVDRITVLEQLLESYKKDLIARKPIKDSFEGCEFYQGMLWEKNKEIEELRKQLSTMTLTEMLLSRAVNEANAEKRKWKLEASLKQTELDMLLIAGQETKNTASEVDSIKQQPMIPKNKESEGVKQQGKGILKNSVATKTSGQQTRTTFSIKPKYVDANQIDSIKTKTSSQSDLQYMSNKNTGSIPTEIINLEDSTLEKTGSCTVNDRLNTNNTVLSNVGSSISNTDDINLGESALKESTGDNLPREINEKTFCLETESNEKSEDIENTYLGSHINDSTRTVTFSANTVSPKIGHRKGRKLIVCKPIVYNSSFK